VARSGHRGRRLLRAEEEVHPLGLRPTSNSVLLASTWATAVPTVISENLDFKALRAHSGWSRTSTAGWCSRRLELVRSAIQRLQERREVGCKADKRRRAMRPVSDRRCRSFTVGEAYEIPAPVISYWDRARR
jgi:hypothetical protein